MRSYFEQEKMKAAELMLDENDSANEVYMEFFLNICDRILEATSPDDEFYNRKR